ncbi:hypothetical protein N0V90_004359 [Kalmusia sp. IMI 367209]|nr:hypothetical protein N0V90_004359 [Kalmusia sp. IMI 367209]
MSRLIEKETGSSPMPSDTSSGRADSMGSNNTQKVFPPYADSGNFDDWTRPSSMLADFHNTTPGMKPDTKCAVIVNFIRNAQEKMRWTTGAKGEGIYSEDEQGIAVMTVKTTVIDMLLSDGEIPFVQIHEGLRLQVIPNLSALPNCQKNQSAAFILSEKMLVVWEDQPVRLLDRAKFIESSLYNMVFDILPQNPELGKEDPRNTLHQWQGVHEDNEKVDKRAIIILQPFFTACTLILVASAIGAGWRHIAIQTTVDGNFYRLLFLLCLIPQAWLSMFFFQTIVGTIAQIFGPTGQLRRNTKHYSGKRPHRLCDTNLPHVTVQMPVFKESLRRVIVPTIRSIKEAISTYEMQGGSANIIINDDGMQLLDDARARERQEYYDENNIGWVARPPHNPKGKFSGLPRFNRRGKFKKASNMIYAMCLSVEVEKALAKVDRDDAWTQKEENEAYSDVLSSLVDRNGAWAEGNIRIGDYILLVDSDTRVPNDCLLEAVSEMEKSKDVAILQFASGVMNVTDSFFEKGITFFTNLVYTQIKYSVANGDVAPFVGHNAILRWSAIQEVAFYDKAAGKELYWSEDTVSEDFDMALRLQTKGCLVRLGAYQGDGFKEGVSLTVYDELHRWEKYAYGCNELIFHPIWNWPLRGPFTSLFIRFITSGIPLTSKLTIVSYIGSYYALGSSWILTLANYFLVGWFNGLIDHYYLDSFKVYFSIICVFTALGNTSLAILRYRIKDGGLIENLWSKFKWVPLLVIFLGGLSLHVSQALLSHMFGVGMNWGATAKEVESIPFFEEIANVLRRFKGTFVFCVGSTAMMIAFAYRLPPLWQIRFFTPIWPLSCVTMSHFLMPIVLNPNLMLFTW